MRKERRETIAPDNIRKSTQAVKVLLAKPEFRNEIAKLRLKWGVDEHNPDKEKNIKRLEFLRLIMPVHKAGRRGMEMCDYPTFKQLSTDLRTLMKQFNLDSQYWLVLLWEYVRMGRFDEESLNFNLSCLDAAPIIRFETQPTTNKRKIVIELGDNTTLKDVKAAWREVEEMRKQLNLIKPKFKEWKNFDRDNKIYALYQQGLTISEISNRLFKEDGVDLDYGNIKKIVTTYRKRVGLPKGGQLLTSPIKVNRRRLR